MSIFNDVNDILNNITKNIVKTYDTSKLERKLKDYKKEEERLYNSIGKLIYTEYENNNKNAYSSKIYSLCKEIKIIISRKKSIEKQILDIKNNNREEINNGIIEPIENTQEINYSKKLNKKSNDLKLIRTNEGIKLIKYCTASNTNNNSEDTNNN